MQRHLLVLSLVLSSSFLCAQEPVLRLAPVFGSHMVLQQSTDAPVWGSARPGATVTVAASFAEGASWNATADAKGHWAVRVPTPAAGGPHVVRVQSGTEQVVLEDVLLGEVWLGSGQSNMEWLVRWLGGWGKNFQAPAEAANLPKVRLFTVKKQVAPAPVADIEGAWSVCTPESALDFSAVAFYFGAKLHRDLDVPVGLVVSAWGGTVCEAWNRSSALADFPEFQPGIAALAGSGEKEHARNLAAWWKQVEAKEPVTAAAAEGAVEVALPHRWSQAGLADFDGTGWYTRRVELPKEWVGRKLDLEIGPVDDMDTVFWNGERVAGTERPGAWNRNRRYVVPADRVLDQANMLAVRVVDTSGEGGIARPAAERGDGAAQTAAARIGADGSWQVVEDGWRFRKGAAMGALPPMPHDGSNDPNRPTVLWNGMMAPLVPFAFRGAIWYQGESNRGRHEQYERMFPGMIADWREAFGRDMAFHFVQLAPFTYGGDTGQTGDIRAAQQAALALPGTGMAVTMDVGDPRDIHPANKLAVGERLALAALARTYGKSVEWEGPTAPTFAVKDGVVTVAFARGTGGGLRTKGGPLPGFELAGADGTFRAAEAWLEDGDRVQVRCAEVAEPKAIRYAWGDAVMTELWNGSGLPAWPFRATL